MQTLVVDSEIKQVQADDCLFSIRHDFLYQGKYLHFLGSGVESPNMTALVSVYTNKGFVFGADGRSIVGGVVERDDAQKIHGCRATNVRALFGWSGSATFGNLRDDFDLQLNTLAILKGYEKVTFSNIAEYGYEIATTISARMRSHLSKISSKLDPSLRELATLSFVGYVDGKPQSVQICLLAIDGFLDDPKISRSHYPPTPSLEVSSGCRTAYESYKTMVDRGEMLPCTTLVDGSALIQKYIQTCADEKTESANPIGGHIHVAAITPYDSEWMVSPKP